MKVARYKATKHLGAVLLAAEIHFKCPRTVCGTKDDTSIFGVLYSGSMLLHEGMKVQLAQAPRHERCDQHPFTTLLRKSFSKEVRTNR